MACSVYAAAGTPRVSTADPKPQNVGLDYTAPRLVVILTRSEAGR